VRIKRKKILNLNISIKNFEICSYLAYDVVTTIKEIKETASEFPDITLCELDPLTKPDSIKLFDKIARKYQKSNWTYDGL